MWKEKVKISAALVAFTCFVSIFSVFMLMGCGEAKLTKICILNHKVEQAAGLEKVCRYYEASHPGIRIDVQSVGGGSDYKSVVQNAIKNNSADLLNVEGIGEFEALKDHLVDLSEMQLVKDASPEIFDAFKTTDGKIYGVPYALEGTGWMVNTAVCTAAGIDISNIKSWPDFEAAVKTIDDAIKSGKLKKDFPNLKAAISVFFKDPWAVANHMFHAIVSKDFKNGSEAYNSKDFAFSSSVSFHQLLDFFKNYAWKDEKLPDGLGSIDYNKCFDDAFLNGKVALVPVGSWAGEAIEKHDSEHKTKLGEQVDLLPLYLPGEAEGKYIILLGQGWAINKSSKPEVVEETKKFLAWLYTDKKAASLFAKEVKCVSPFIKKSDLKNKDNKENEDKVEGYIFKYNRLNKRVIDAYVSGNFYLGGSIGLSRTEDFSLKILGAAVSDYVTGKISYEEMEKRVKQGWTNGFSEQVEKKSS